MDLSSLNKIRELLEDCCDCSSIEIRYHTSNEDGGGNYYPGGFSLDYSNDEGRIINVESPTLEGLLKLL